jgi:hypothetical protein
LLRGQGTATALLRGGPPGVPDTALTRHDRQGTPGLTSLRFRVLLDGQPPGTAHGSDVDGHGHGNGTVTQSRLYQLIRQPGPITDHTFEITFLDPGAKAYAFTFG